MQNNYSFYIFFLLEIEREDLNNNSWLVRLKRCNPFWAIIVVPLNSNWLKCNKVTENCFAGSAATQRISTLALLAFFGQITTGSSELFVTKLHQVATISFSCANGAGAPPRPLWPVGKEASEKASAAKINTKWIWMEVRENWWAQKTNEMTPRSGGKSKTTYQAMLGHCLVCWVQLWFCKGYLTPYCSDLVITVSQIPSHTQNHHNFCIVNDTRWQQKDLHK